MTTPASRWLLVLLVLSAADLASAQTSPDDAKTAKAHFKQGEKLINQKKFDEAIAELEAAYELDPQQEHLYNLAVAHQLRGDDAIAAEYYRLFLLDAPPSKTARDASTYLTALEKKAADARAEKAKKDIADAQAKGAQGNSQSTAEMLLYAQYAADAEAKEHRVAILDEELKADDAEILKQKQRDTDERTKTRAAMARAQRWERQARSAPSGDGRGRRIFGAILMTVGTGLATMGVHDILSRERGVTLTDNSSIYLGAGTGALLLGLGMSVWGEGAAEDPRPSSTFQLTPTLGRDAGGLSLTHTF